MAATRTTFQQLEPEARQGNTEKLEWLVMHEMPKFYRQAYRQLDNAHDAEDAVQDAVLSAYKNLSQFRGTAQLSTWFTAIVINAARMQRRRRRPVVSLDEQLSSSEDALTLLDTCEDYRPDPEEIYADSELRKLLAEGINRLSPASRRVMRLRYSDGMSAAEAAATLGVPVGTIKAQLSRARAKLAKLLRRELGPRRPAAKVNKTRVAQ